MVRTPALMIVAALVIPACYASHRPEDGSDSGGDSSPFTGDSGQWLDAGHWWPDGEPRDVGPVCPEDVGPIEEFECDVLVQDCGAGLACYSWIDDTDEVCVREIYRAQCLTPGVGGQGDPCDAWCQAGFECFVTGEGTQCLRVCDILGSLRSCPPGYICQPTDLPGLGACH